MRKMATVLGAMAMILAVAGCVPTSGPTFATTVQSGHLLTANAGDTVLDARMIQPDLINGTIETGRTVVRFTGSDASKRAVFVRDYVVLSDRYDAALWTPTGVPPSPLPGYTTANQPIVHALLPGEVLPLEGRRLIVVQVRGNVLEYTFE
ncbi:MAG: hypothetical protein KIT36_02950 [Alphaproteobacteria bacterium]|nr:hypothetical protein [Alphaproteobacteria bacterium]